MKLLHGFENSAEFRGGIVSIGNFDGVHRGHQEIVNRLVQRAHDSSVPAVVFTFDPHPVTLLRPEVAPPSLSTLERKAELIAACGADALIAYPTDQKLLQLTAEQFFKLILQEELSANGLVEGENFFFGRDRMGNVETLRKLSAPHDITVEVVPSLQFGNQVVSSSVIRNLVSEGRLAEAVDLLGHPYQMQGRVAEGAKRGRTIGFPTANLEQVQTLLPKNGVYAGVTTLSETTYPAAIHIGPNPTFDDKQRKIEIHVVGFKGDLYGCDLRVNFLDRIREIATFSTTEELQAQLHRDVNEVSKLVIGQKHS